MSKIFSTCKKIRAECGWRRPENFPIEFLPPIMVSITQRMVQGKIYSAKVIYKTRVERRCLHKKEHAGNSSYFQVSSWSSPRIYAYAYHSMEKCHTNDDFFFFFTKRVSKVARTSFIKIQSRSLKLKKTGWAHKKR